MTDDSLQAENKRLRAELEARREREVQELRAALATAQQQADHYRTEAYRNAEAARQLDAEHERENRELRGRIDALTQALTEAQAQTHARRFQRN